MIWGYFKGVYDDEVAVGMGIVEVMRMMISKYMGIVSIFWVMMVVLPDSIYSCIMVLIVFCWEKKFLGVRIGMDGEAWRWW